MLWSYCAVRSQSCSLINDKMQTVWQTNEQFLHNFTNKSEDFKRFHKIFSSTEKERMKNCVDITISDSAPDNKCEGDFSYQFILNPKELPITTATKSERFAFLLFAESITRRGKTNCKIFKFLVFLARLLFSTLSQVLQEWNYKHHGA